MFSQAPRTDLEVFVWAKTMKPETLFKGIDPLFENLNVKPIVGYVNPENGLYITTSDIVRAKAEIADSGPICRPEQRQTPFNAESLKKPSSQYIHT